MDFLQNNLQKNRVRLEAMTVVMVGELRALKTTSERDFSLIVNKFKDIYSDYFYKV